MPRLCGFYPGICLTTEEKARKNLSQGSRRVPAGTMKIHKYTKRIHRHNNKNTYKQQLHVVCMSSNNVGHLITTTVAILQHFTSLHHASSNYISLHLSTLHFLSFTLHYPLISLNPITFPIVRFHLLGFLSVLVGCLLKSANFESLCVILSNIPYFLVDKDVILLAPCRMFPVYVTFGGLPSSTPIQNNK